MLDAELVQKGLSNTLFSVVVRNDTQEIIGMGRVIGDGAVYLHIQDVIVHPAYQRQGVGKLMMRHIMDFVDRTAGKNTNVGLMSSRGREKFYSDLGFIERPNDRFGSGMILIK